MAALTLDQILNFIIPPLAVIFVIVVCLYPFREPLGKMWNKIKEWKENREESYEESYINSITYE